MSFQERLAAAEAHERAVQRRLEAAGWTVVPFGQGQLPAEMRDALRRVKTPARWLPDLLAARRVGRRTVAVFVDAKTGRADTANYDIEWECVLSLVRFAKFSRLPVVFVMHDFGVLYPEFVRFVSRHGVRTGHGGKGSGTPYCLVRKTLAAPFDSFMMNMQTIANPTDF